MTSLLTISPIIIILLFFTSIIVFIGINSASLSSVSHFVHYILTQYNFDILEENNILFNDMLNITSRPLRKVYYELSYEITYIYIYIYIYNIDIT